MFKDNFESSKVISVSCRIISFVPKYIFSVSGYRHVALLILFYMKKKKNTENNLDMKRLQCCLGFTPTVANYKPLCLVSKMKLAKLVSVFLKEDITQTFLLETRSECKWPTEHATMLKDMFDKQEGIF